MNDPLIPVPRSKLEQIYRLLGEIVHEVDPLLFPPPAPGVFYRMPPDSMPKFTDDPAVPQEAPVPSPALPAEPIASTPDVVSVAICVGHSRGCDTADGDHGAKSAGGVWEWDFNRDIAKRLQAVLLARGIGSAVIDHYLQGDYSSAMIDLGRRLKKVSTLRCAVELHFNSNGATAKGFEYLFVTDRGRWLAQGLHDAHSRGIMAGVSRGVKVADRGREFLLETPCPAAICEPFFGTNPSEWAYWSTHQDQLAEIYANGIEAFLKL